MSDAGVLKTLLVVRFTPWKRPGIMWNWKHHLLSNALTLIAFGLLIALFVVRPDNSALGQEQKTPPRKIEQKAGEQTEQKTEAPQPAAAQEPKSDRRENTAKAPKKNEEKVAKDAASQKQTRTIQSGTIKSINAEKKTFVLRVEGLTGKPMDHEYAFKDGCVFNRGCKLGRDLPKVGDLTSVVFDAGGIGEYGLIHDNNKRAIHLLNCRFNDFDPTTGTIRILYINSVLHPFAKGTATVHTGGVTSSFENLVMNEKITIAWYDNAGTYTLVDLWTDRDYLVAAPPVD